MVPMVSMELDDEDILDMPCPIDIPARDRPRYPYNLQIALTESEFRKFAQAGVNIDPADAFVGGIVHLHALARITSVSENQTEGGVKFRMELTLEDLGIESEDIENAEAE